MKHLRAYIYIIGIVLVMGVTAACSVSYKFNGAGCGDTHHQDDAYYIYVRA